MEFRNALKKLKGYTLDPRDDEYEDAKPLFGLMNIFCFENVVDEEFCKRVRRFFDQNRHRAVRQFGKTKNENRQGLILPIVDKQIDGEIFREIGKIINHLSSKLGRDLKLIDSGYTVVKYEIGEGCLCHFDGLFDPSGLYPHPRAWAVTIFLNDVEVGGENVFTRQQVSVRPRQGACIVYPGPFDRYIHSVNAPSSAPRYVLTTWLHDPSDEELISKVIAAKE